MADIHSIAGSERKRSPHTKYLRPVDAGEIISVTLILRSRPGAPPLPDLAHWQNTPPGKRKFYSSQEYIRTFGADPEDVVLVENYINSHGMTVLESHAGRKTLHVQGDAAQIKKAFGVNLNWYEATDHTHYGYDGNVQIPAELASIVTAVVGLDNRQVVRRHTGTGDPAPTAGGTTGLMQAPAVAALYNFPNSGASNQVIGIFAPQNTPGVGASYLASDITSYFTGLSDATYQTQPTLNDISLTVGSKTFANNSAAVTAITSSAAINTPKTNLFILEAVLDICMAATIAQGATINVYFTENSEQGYIVFLNRILLPQGEKQPTVVSISYGNTGDETGNIGSYTDSGSIAFQRSALFQQVAALGINTFVSAGDNGSDANNTDGSTHVSYPGSDPWVTCCGGTVIGNVHSAPSSFQEVVWSDSFTTTGSSFGSSTSNFGSTGGGASANFPIPPYQTAYGLTQITDSKSNVLKNRFTPDVAGMVGYTGFFINGISTGAIGTSAVAPMYAGLTAVLEQAFGISLGFLNPSFYQLGGTAFNDITSGNNDSGDTPAAPFFTAGTGWDPCTGLGSIDGTKLLNGLAALMYNQTFYFAAKKDTFGLDEVAVNQSPAVTGDSTYSKVVWLVLEGYTPNAVGTLIIPKVAGTLTLLDGVTVTVGSPQPQVPNFRDTPQRILYPCTLVFAKSAIADNTNSGVFPDAGQAAFPCPLSALFKVAGQPFTATMIFELIAGADPSFANYDDNNDNAFYLSQDLRVFTVTPGINNAPLFGITLGSSNNKDFDTNAGYAYIKSLINYLDFNYNSPSNGDPFTSFPDQSNLYSLDSSVTPHTVNPADPGGDPFANYNFAVARVRLTDKPNIPTNGNVKVFFRLFVTESTDTDYIPDFTYPSVNDAQGFPSSPLVGIGNTTIPFFATGNYETNDDFDVNSDYSSGSVNNKSINSGIVGSAFAYFGCYLNLYPGNNKIDGNEIQSMLAGSHHCIVAQIAYDDAPIPVLPGSAVSPENSDKLAQRNLQITLSDNPGPPSTHRIPQTFDLRPSYALSTMPGDLLDYPDELMIEWGNTPVGSVAHIYWPQVPATDVLNLAKKFYSTHLLSAADPYTIQCTTHDGFTFVPIPPGTGENFAGLFTVDLPPGVVSGQVFTITVRRLSTKQGKDDQPGNPTRRTGPIEHGPIDQGPGPINIIEAGGPAIGAAPSIPILTGTHNEKGKVMRNWRYVVGSFAVRIPVTTAKKMLWPEENTLAIMKWRLLQLVPGDRWYPVLLRYIGYIAGRIDGLGGNSTQIKPSPYGLVPYDPGRPGRHPGGHQPGGGKPGGYHDPYGDSLVKGHFGHTGKVSGLIFDGFGDFEGFILDTLCGDVSFFSREREIKLLAERAWRERLLITVRTGHEHSSRPLSIIIHYPPAPF